MTIFDDVNRKVTFYHPPQRIVSLVPSLTELLFDLGLDNEIVGITKFCIYPENKIINKVKVGGTKNFKIPQILNLNPDIVIANKEENTKELIEELEKYIPVYITNIYDLETAIESIENVGFIVDKKIKAKEYIELINEKIYVLDNLNLKRYKCVYLIWKQPLMTISKDTFIYSMLHIGGFDNIYPESNMRYPEINLDELQQINPEFLFLSTEPYLFKESHKKYFKEYLPNSNIMIVDGSYFSWYGSRILKGLDYIINLRKSI